MNKLSWNEKVVIFSINPEAASRHDIVKLASELMAANKKLSNLLEACEKAKREIMESLEERFVQIPFEWYPGYLDAAIAKAKEGN